MCVCVQGFIQRGGGDALGFPQNFRIVYNRFNASARFVRTELVADLLLILHGKYSYINVNSVNMNIYTWHRRKCYVIPIRR